MVVPSLVIETFSSLLGFFILKMVIKRLGISVADSAITALSRTLIWVAIGMLSLLRRKYKDHEGHFVAIDREAKHLVSKLKLKKIVG